MYYIVYFKILLWVVFFLLYKFVLAVCCEGPQIIMDVALYEIKYYYVIIKLIISCIVVIIIMNYYSIMYN